MLPLLMASLAAASAHAGNAANGDILAAVNWARQRGCNAAATRVPLQNNPKLQNAAGRLAGGSGLHEALAAAGYLASESSALHFSGAVSDAQITRTLTTSYCRTLVNPKLQEIGSERRGRDGIPDHRPVACRNGAGPGRRGRRVHAGR